MPRPKKADSNRKPPPGEMNDFPRRLREAVKASPLSRPEIAKRSDVDNPTLGRWMKGDGWEGAEGARFVKLALVLEVSLDWLLLGKEPSDDTSDLAVIFENSERGNRLALDLERRLQSVRESLELSPNEALASDDS